MLSNKKAVGLSNIDVLFITNFQKIDFQVTYSK